MNPRPLLTALLLAAAACGPSSRPGPAGDPPPKKGEAKEDPAAVAALEKLGAVLTRDEKLPGRPVVKVEYRWPGGEFALPGGAGPLEKLPGLAHLRELQIGHANNGLPAKALAGLSSLEGLRSVDMNHCAIDDAGLAALAGLPKVERLHLRSSRVTAAGLAPLAKMEALRDLDLGNSPGVDDDSLKHVAGLKKLELLKIPGCPKVTDAGLASIAGLTALRELDLERSAVTDEGVKKLAALAALKSLNLSDTKVSDAGLSALAGLPLEDLELARAKAAGAGLGKFKGLLRVSLREAPVTAGTFDALAAVPYLRKVDLGGTSAGDAGLEKLKAKATLRELDLSSTKVTSAGLAHLEEMPRLEKVTLSVDPAGDEKTAVVPAAVERLREALPRLKIVD